jgi:hypothetical protein
MLLAQVLVNSALVLINIPYHRLNKSFFYKFMNNFTTNTTIATLNYQAHPLVCAFKLQAHPLVCAFECLGPNVPLELVPARRGLRIQCGGYEVSS